MIKKVSIAIITVIVLVVCLVGINGSKQKELDKQHKELVSEYVTCLKEHFTQRAYCGNKLGTDYNYLDQLLDKYGYKYVTKGLDLYVVEK